VLPYETQKNITEKGVSDEKRHIQAIEVIKMPVTEYMMILQQNPKQQHFRTKKQDCSKTMYKDNFVIL